MHKACQMFDSNGENLEIMFTKPKMVYRPKEYPGFYLRKLRMATILPILT